MVMLMSGEMLDFMSFNLPGYGSAAQLEPRWASLCH